jgi:hypothetical protein
MSQRDDDLKMLDELLGKELWEIQDRHDSLTTAEVEAFTSMRWDLRAYQSNTTHRGFEFLTDKQRVWLQLTHERVTGGGYENLASRGLIPEPKKPGEPGYVALMVGALPKRPPPLPQRTVPQRASQEHRPFRATGLDDKDDDDA